MAPGLSVILGSDQGQTVMGRRADPTLRRPQALHLIAHAPQRLHQEVAVDCTDVIYATASEEIEVRRWAFLHK